VNCSEGEHIDREQGGSFPIDFGITPYARKSNATETANSVAVRHTRGADIEGGGRYCRPYAGYRQDVVLNLQFGPTHCRPVEGVESRAGDVFGQQWRGASRLSSR
jgi:hypothetical protein